MISGPSTSLRNLDVRVLDHVQLRAFDRFLCLECGDGWVVEEAWRRARRGYSCGVDRSEALIARANASRAVPGGVEFKTWDGRQLPYPNDCFHVVLAFFAPSNPPDLINLLAELQRVLRPGGEMHFVDASGASAGGQQSFASELVHTLTRAGFWESRVDDQDLSTRAGGDGSTALLRAWHKPLAK